MSPIGSSPHARGTLCRARDQFSCWRFIPACAGNAQVKRHVAACPSVHPRMRGERVTMARGGVRWLGSSPHARGMLSLDSGEGKPCRFIPACAGNVSTKAAMPSCYSVHPRMRGERVFHLVLVFGGVGSSSHARETPVSGAAERQGRRFILACAGNTLPAEHCFIT
jgi:hypothetical protein